MALDRPSEKCLNFLDKYYSLNKPIKQRNNYVVFEGFFPENHEEHELDGRRSASLDKNFSANGLQSSPAYGRYGPPRPPSCSMGQIIHNQTSAINSSSPIGSVPEQFRSQSVPNYFKNTIVTPNPLATTPNINAGLSISDEQRNGYYPYPPNNYQIGDCGQENINQNSRTPHQNTSFQCHQVIQQTPNPQGLQQQHNQIVPFQVNPQQSLNTGGNQPYDIPNITLYPTTDKSAPNLSSHNPSHVTYRSEHVIKTRNEENENIKRHQDTFNLATGLQHQQLHPDYNITQSIDTVHHHPSLSSTRNVFPSNMDPMNLQKSHEQVPNNNFNISYNNPAEKNESITLSAQSHQNPQLNNNQFGYQNVQVMPKENNYRYSEYSQNIAQNANISKIVNNEITTIPVSEVTQNRVNSATVSQVAQNGITNAQPYQVSQDHNPHEVISQQVQNVLTNETVSHPIPPAQNLSFSNTPAINHHEVMIQDPSRTQIGFGHPSNTYVSSINHDQVMKEPIHHMVPITSANALSKTVQNQISNTQHMVRINQENNKHEIMQNKNWHSNEYTPQEHPISRTDNPYQMVASNNDVNGPKYYTQYSSNERETTEINSRSPPHYSNVNRSATGNTTHQNQPSHCNVNPEQRQSAPEIVTGRAPLPDSFFLQQTTSANILDGNRQIQEHNKILSQSMSQPLNQSIQKQQIYYNNGRPDMAKYSESFMNQKQHQMPKQFKDYGVNNRTLGLNKSETVDEQDEGILKYGYPPQRLKLSGTTGL